MSPSSLTRLAASLTGFAFVTASLVTPVAAATAATTPQASVATAAKKPTYGHANPTPGLRLNNPLGDRTDRRMIIAYLLRSINSTPPGATIKAQSWSLRSPALVTALLNAHKRGVGVQVIIDRGTTKPSNPDFRKLRLGLAAGNTKRPAALRSGAYTCASSCRGKSGIAHSKLYLFSQTGSTKYVTMYGSANLTDLAAAIQWNDLYTVVNNQALYSTAAATFDQARLDRAQTAPVVSTTVGNLTMSFLPWYGAGATGDPAMSALNPIHCTGAASGYGNKGRTVVRVAQTAFLDARGIALARKLHSLRDAGCDVKVIYSIMGGAAYKELASTRGRGRVPMRQLAIDRNHDHLYDRYLHLKVLTVQGVYGTDPKAAIAWNGSSNWSAASLASDDIFARLVSASVTKTYRAFVDRWFVRGPGVRTAPPVAKPLPAGVDPRKLLQLD